jgi:hypothetical protein
MMSSTSLAGAPQNRQRELTRIMGTSGPMIELHRP